MHVNIFDLLLNGHIIHICCDGLDLRYFYNLVHVLNHRHFDHFLNLLDNRHLHNVLYDLCVITVYDLGHENDMVLWDLNKLGHLLLCLDFYKLFPCLFDDDFFFNIFVNDFLDLDNLFLEDLNWTFSNQIDPFYHFDFYKLWHMNDFLRNSHLLLLANVMHNALPVALDLLLTVLDRVCGMMVNVIGVDNVPWDLNNLLLLDNDLTSDLHLGRNFNNLFDWDYPLNLLDDRHLTDHLPGDNLGNWPMNNFLDNLFDFDDTHPLMNFWHLHVLDLLLDHFNWDLNNFPLVRVLRHLNNALLLPFNNLNNVIELDHFLPHFFRDECWDQLLDNFDNFLDLVDGHWHFDDF